MKHITIIHGPNLNLLGKREPIIYGEQGFDSYLKQLQKQFANLKISYYQSNVEGELINYIQQCECDGIIINAGGYAHTSIALADAVSAINTLVVNVHISNIYSREKERHTELLAQYCVAGIYGMGLEGYNYAIHFLTNSNNYE
jgi:3-dehydroquinate dehydratase-2